MTTLEILGAIVSMAVGLVGIGVSVHGFYQKRREKKEKLVEEAITLQLRIKALEEDNEQSKNDIRELRSQYDEFMHDMLKYFQIR